MFLAQRYYKGQLCTHIIDGGSVMNGVSQEFVNKLDLTLKVHPTPYHVAGVNGDKISIALRCEVDFFGRTCKETIWCDVFPMTVSSSYLNGHSCLSDRCLLIGGCYMMATSALNAHFSA